MARHKNLHAYPKESISITLPYGYKSALIEIAGQKGITVSCLISNYIKKENPTIKEIVPDGKREAT